MDFPCWRYHPVHARAGYLFKSQEQLDSAGPGWFNTPAAFGVVTHPPEQIPGVPQPPVAVSPAPVPVAPSTAVEPPDIVPRFPSKTYGDGGVSAQEAKLMNKPELYAFAVDIDEIKEEVPADIETITKKDLLTLVLSSLPKDKPKES